MHRPIGTRGLRAKGMQRSTFGVTRSEVMVTMPKIELKAWYHSPPPRPSSFFSYLRCWIAASGAYTSLYRQTFFSNRYSCYSFCPILNETLHTCYICPYKTFRPMWNFLAIFESSKYWEDSKISTLGDVPQATPT